MVDWEEFYNRFRAPDFIAGYEIQNHLGGGAFGEVYKARKSSIGKYYAIKFLRLDGGSNRHAVDRELDQVRLFASIDHPNLVTIEDMGIAMGVPYLIMGYAGEETLARRFEKRDVDRKSGMRYFVQACRGVLALHDRRLAHFDIKPGNIFIKGDVARVGDYGLAKLLTEGRQTLSFGRGTPHYMAPEMLKKRADHRADVYSLGVILFESLTLELPFGAQEQGGLVVRETDEPPDFPEDFPADVRPVVCRCLRLDPAQRYSSVHDLLAELGQTSRQGDSVRIRFGELGAITDTQIEEQPDASGGGIKGEEIKQAVAEIARGAVGVARGVWDGVRDRAASRAGPEPAEEPADPVEQSLEVEQPLDEIVSVQSLDEPELDPVTRVTALPALLGSGSQDSGSTHAFVLTAPYGPGPTGGTVPVPPRAEGGVLGTISAALVLGAEIFGALVTGPALFLMRATAQVGDRLAQGVPGFSAQLLRWGLYLFVLALLGGLCAFVILTVIAIHS